MLTQLQIKLVKVLESFQFALNRATYRRQIAELQLLLSSPTPANSFMDIEGLCPSLGIDRIADLATGWVHYSGERRYPVKGKGAYLIAEATDTLWQGENGELRRDLCQFMIQQLNRLLNNQPLVEMQPVSAIVEQHAEAA